MCTYPLDSDIEFVPHALPKTYADATSHAGFPALQPSKPIQNDLSDLDPDKKQGKANLV